MFLFAAKFLYVSMIFISFLFSRGEGRIFSRSFRFENSEERDRVRPLVLSFGGYVDEVEGNRNLQKVVNAKKMADRISPGRVQKSIRRDLELP